MYSDMLISGHFPIQMRRLSEFVSVRIYFSNANMVKIAIILSNMSSARNIILILASYLRIVLRSEYGMTAAGAGAVEWNQLREHNGHRVT